MNAQRQQHLLVDVETVLGLLMILAMALQISVDCICGCTKFAGQDLWKHCVTHL